MIQPATTADRARANYENPYCRNREEDGIKEGLRVQSGTLENGESS